MDLTEEEKKKQKQLSQEQANKESALDAIYNENKAYLQKQKQLQMEDAYVNQELMNKYLNESLAQQGLDKSGVANLYRQQLNTDYMNTRANIANRYDQDQLELLNQYNADKKTEQDKFQKQMYDMYTNKIASSVNDYEFIDDDTLAALNQYITDNADKFGSDYQSLLQTQLDLYKGNEEQINAYNQGNYEAYLNDVYSQIGDAQSIADEDYDELVGELEILRSKIGEDNYTDAIQSLTAYKFMGDITESLNTNNKISSANYEVLKSSLDELKASGLISNKDYNSFVELLENSKMSVELEQAANRAKEQEMLTDAIYNTSNENYENALGAYIKGSDDAYMEKIVRSIGSNIKQKYNDAKKAVSEWLKKYIMN